MTQEKWENLIEMIKRNYQVIDHKTEEILEGKGTCESIIFEGPMGKIKLEREIKPLVTGKKVLSSHRSGGAVLEEWEYSDSEKVDKLNAYRWDVSQEEWLEINANQIGNLTN